MSILDFIIIKVAFLTLWHYVLAMSYNVPYQYALCQNSSCPQASECLRACAYAELTADTKSIYIVNPQCYPKDGKPCDHFRSTQKITFAWGIKNFYQTMSYPIAKELKRTLLGKLGRTKYYRFFREELPIKPADQKLIKRVFEDNEIETEPAYTRFTQEYDWTY